jgi:hypothetical protein
MSRTLSMIRPSEPHAFRTRLRFLALKRATRENAGLTMQDAREFMMAYCACFLAVSAFIA